MERIRKELLDFIYWQDENYDYLGWSNEQIVDYYLQLKSNKPSERETVTRNERTQSSVKKNASKRSIF